jgi:FkbH-like protein
MSRNESVLRIAVACTFTPLSLPAALGKALAHRGVTAETYAVPVGQGLTQLADSSSPLHDFQPDVVTMFLGADDLLPAEWSPTDLTACLAHALDRLETIAHHLASFTARTGGIAVTNTVAINPLCLKSVISWKHRAAFGRMWRRLNDAILELAEHERGLHVLDLEMLAAASGTAVTDQRLVLAARAAWTPRTEKLVAQELARLAVALTGQAKRVIAVDFDNTLWGGVVAESGIAGIELGGAFYPGNAHAAFQHGLRRLREQGVVLVATSKNDWDTARAVFEKHPESVLAVADFAVLAVGWDPKALLIRRAMEELNLGPDRAVLVDDSAAERAAVESELLTTMTIDASPPEQALGRLLDEAVFDVVDLTADDRRRTDYYHGRKARQISEVDSGSRESFLAGLRTHVRVAAVAPATVARFDQLSARANQFNTTGRPVRGSTTDGAFALCFWVDDRFVDEGQVGGLLVRPRACSLAVGNFFMSCRVMGRSIEAGVLGWLLGAWSRTGPEPHRLHLAFVDTDRNGPARRAFQTAGGRDDDCPECGPVLTFDATSGLTVPAWLTIDDEFGDLPPVPAGAPA